MTHSQLIAQWLQPGAPGTWCPHLVSIRNQCFRGRREKGKDGEDHIPQSSLPRNHPVRGLRGIPEVRIGKTGLEVLDVGFCCAEEKMESQKPQGST